jgi:osmotically-inducible protein OsmY
MAQAPDHTVGSEQLSDDITHALGHSWFFDPQTITVQISGSAVTLIGTVRSDRERKMAGAAAWAEPGVTNVVNNLTIG